MKKKVVFISTLTAMELVALITYVLLRVNKMDINRGFIEQAGYWPILAYVAVEFFIMVVTKSVAEQLYDAIIAIRADRVSCPSATVVQDRILKKVFSKANDKLVWYLYFRDKRLTLGRLELIAAGFSKDNADELVLMLREYKVMGQRADLLTRESYLFKNVCYKNGRLQLYFNEAALGDLIEEMCDTDDEEEMA